MGKQYPLTKRKSDPQTIRLTDRDVAMLKALYAYTLLSTNLLFLVVGGGRDGLRKRLRLLFDNGYVARPPIQNDLFRYGDERPMVYTLGKQGAEYLRVVCDMPLLVNVDWERKARDRKGLRGQFKLLHDLRANEVHLRLKAAMSDCQGIECLTPDEIIEQAPESTQKAARPFSIPTRFTWADGTLHERNVIPDGVLGVIDTRSGTPVTSLLFIELDQEMDIKRSDPRQSSIVQKVASYSAMLKAQTVKQRFGFEHFRVLFVTTGSQSHMEYMVAACAEYRGAFAHKIPPYPFFFSTFAGLRAAPDMLSDVWCDGAGKSKPLIRY